MSSCPDFLGVLSLIPDSEHLWHLIEALALPVAAWEALKHLYRWIFKRRSRLEQRLELVEKENNEKTENIRKLSSEKNQLSAELEQAKGKLPQTAIARADRERRDRNTLAAVRQLETWFEENAESIAAIALHLVKFHISRAVPDPGTHLDRARDLLRLARGALPDNREAQELSSQLDTVNAGLQEQMIREGDVQIAWNSKMAPPLGAQSEAMLPAVNAFREIARFCYEKGLWRLTPIFAERAADIALSGGSALRRVWFSAETCAAFHQVLVAEAADGLQRLDHVLAEARKFLAADDVIVVSARHARAEALRCLGRDGEALLEVDALAPIQTKVRGARHAETLGTRYLRACILMNLGRYDEALTEIEAFAPIQAQVLGARHPATLSTRHLRAMVFGFLERHHEALVEFESFFPIEIEVRGVNHPETLTTRYHHLQELRSIGRYSDTLIEIDALTQILAEVNGTRHPHTLATRKLWALVVSDLGRYDEAISKIDDLVPIVAEVLGEHHPDTLSIRQCRAFVLLESGRYNDALAEIDAFIRTQAEVLGAHHPITLCTARFRARCLANLGHWDEALGEIETLSRLEESGAPETEKALTRLAKVEIEIAARWDVAHHDSELREIIRLLTLARGSSFTRTLAARYWLSQHLLQSGHTREARTEITNTINQFDQMTDPGHRLLRSAKALLDVIEGHSINETLVV
jgi:tetratricopeptide (TPR) repeat protein